MKKKVALLLAGMCALALLAGCGNENGKEKEKENVTLGEYKGLEVSVEKAEITDEDVKTYIETALSMYPAYEAGGTVVEDGSRVNIDYEGLLDGEAFEGGTASGQTLVIGSNSFIDGFEEGLIGAKAGDTLALDLTFPDPYQNNPDLAGKPVVFNVTVNSIEKKVEMTYDALTDEYVSSNFGQETVEAFKEDVKKTLESTSEYYAQSNLQNAVVEKLQEVCTVNSLPEGLLDEKVKDYKAKFEEMCKEQYDVTLEEYLEKNQQTVEEFDTQVVEYMTKTLNLQTILQTIGEKEGIELDEEGYKEFVNTMLTNYGIESEEELIEQVGEDELKNTYINNKVVDMLVENASVTYTEPAEDTAADKDASAAEDTAADEDTTGEE